MTITTRAIGGKWKARIVRALTREGVLRFAEIRRACPPISDRILSMELEDLEGSGITARTAYAVVPPKAEYSLTPPRPHPAPRHGRHGGLGKQRP